MDERAEMNTGCSDCNKIQTETGSNIRLCPKCELDYLKWYADTAQREYEEAKAEYERKQNERVSSL